MLCSTTDSAENNSPTFKVTIIRHVLNNVLSSYNLISTGKNLLVHRRKAYLQKLPGLCFDNDRIPSWYLLPSPPGS